METADMLLIVDDHEGIRGLLKETCLLLGYEVLTAANGKEALELIGSNDIKAALVDMEMPGLSGLETIERMCRIVPQIKAVVMTGYGGSLLLEDAIKHGACAMLKKPFDLEGIKSLLKRILQP